MKTYKDSIVSYRCTGCGVTVYNATKEMDRCDMCGYKLRKIDKPVKSGGRGVWK